MPKVTFRDSKLHRDDRRAARKRRRDKDMTDSSDDYDIFEGNTRKLRKANEGLLSLHIDANHGFARPFFKRGELPEHSACAGPGWPNVTRMLNRIYRIHARPMYWPHCHMILDDQVGLEKHLRIIDHDSTSSTGPPGGIRNPQLEALRTEVSDSLSGSSRWRKVYQILFPDIGVDDIPSPHYNDSDSEDDKAWAAIRVEEIQPSDGPDVQPAAGASRRQNKFAKGRLWDVVRLDTKASEGSQLGFPRARMMYTISADATACNAERHKFLFMTLEHGSRTGLPRKGSS